MYNSTCKENNTSKLTQDNPSMSQALTLLERPMSNYSVIYMSHTYVYYTYLVNLSVERDGTGGCSPLGVKGEVPTYRMSLGLAPHEGRVTLGAE